jgi:ADP-heptose:LPS heptosyltransferase
MSSFAGPYCSPTAPFTALGLLDRFATKLSLPVAAVDLMAGLRTRDRSDGCVVLNLSAGPPGDPDRVRDVPVSFWAEVARALRPHARVRCLVQPGDDTRREDYARLAAEGRFDGVGLECFEHVAETAAWLGRQRLLVSPETGVCHLARNLALPMVVLTPERQVPYWYEPGERLACVYAERLADLDPADVSRACVAVLARA